MRPLSWVLSYFEIYSPPGAATHRIILDCWKRIDLGDLLQLILAQIQIKESEFFFEVFCRFFEVRPNLCTVETYICIKENKSREVLVCYTFLKSNKLFSVQSYNIGIALSFWFWILMVLRGQFAVEIKLSEPNYMLRLKCVSEFIGHVESFCDFVMVSW